MPHHTGLLSTAEGGIWTSTIVAAEPNFRVRQPD